MDSLNELSQYTVPEGYIAPGPETPQLPDDLRRLVNDNEYVRARMLFASRRWDFYDEFQLDGHIYRDESEDYYDDRRRFWNDRRANLEEIGEFLDELEGYADGNQETLAHVAQWRIFESAWRGLDTVTEHQDNLQGPLYHQSREVYWDIIGNGRFWVEDLWIKYLEVAPMTETYQERLLYWDERREHWADRMTFWRDTEDFWNERALFWQRRCELWFERNPAPILLERAQFGHILLQWDFEDATSGDYYSITWFDFLLTNLGFDYDPEDPNQPQLLFEQLETPIGSPNHRLQGPHPALVAMPTTQMTAEMLRDGESTAECPICMEEIPVGDNILLLTTCTHFFHPECILRWSEQSNTCPFCRGEFGAPDDGPWEDWGNEG